MDHKLQRVSKFAAERGMTEGQLRWMIFNARENGLQKHGVIVRIGRTVHIDAGAYDRFVETLRQQQAAA